MQPPDFRALRNHIGVALDFERMRHVSPPLPDIPGLPAFWHDLTWVRSEWCNVLDAAQKRNLRFVGAQLYIGTHTQAETVSGNLNSRNLMTRASRSHG